MEKEIPENLQNFHIKKADETPTTELPKEIFQIWFDAIKNEPPRRNYKIPSKILSLPCGCHRERGNESDPNNAWYVIKKNNQYFHKDCQTELK